jgi:uncharacterized membrane protein YvlD (DUF360 family)
LYFTLSFVLTNRSMVTLGLWPFLTQFTIPVYFFAILCFAFGFLISCIYFWIKTYRMHKAYDALEKRCYFLENKLSAFSSQVEHPS